MQVHLDWHNSLSDDGWTVAQDEEPESEPETRYVAPAPGFGPEGLLVKGIRWKPSEDKLNEWAQAVWDTTLVNGADLTPEQAKHIAKCLWPDIIEWANDNYHGGI